MRSLSVLGLCAALASCGDGGGLGLIAGSGGSQPPAAGTTAGAGAGASGTGSAGQAPVAGTAAGTGGSGGNSGTAAGSGGSAGTAAGSGGAPSSSEKLKASIVVRNVAPGGQEHVCVVVELPNTQPVWVDRVDAVLSGGSHHLIVDRKPASTALNAEPQVCPPTMASDASRLMIAQQAKTAVTLPAGVAFKLDARQRMFMQLHYLNVDDKPHDIRGDIELSLVDTSAGQPIEAKTQFMGSTSINIPARSNSEATAFVKPMASSGKRRLFGLTSHTHRLGVHSTIERVASASAQTSTPLHESRNWSEPPLTFFDPPLVFDGSDGLRLICRYRNDTDQAVNFGVEAQDEMCFMWLYFYDAP